MWSRLERAHRSTRQEPQLRWLEPSHCALATSTYCRPSSSAFSFRCALGESALLWPGKTHLAVTRMPCRHAPRMRSSIFVLNFADQDCRDGLPRPWNVSTISPRAANPSGSAGISRKPTSLHVEQGTPSSPQRQAVGPSHGRSRWVSQTQRRS